MVPTDSRSSRPPHRARDMPRAIAIALLAAGCSRGESSPAASGSPAPQATSAGAALAPAPLPSAPVALPSASSASAPARCELPSDPQPLGDGFRADWPITGIDLSPDGCRIVVTNNIDELLLVDVPTWTVVASIHGGLANRALAAGFLDDQRIAYCGTDDALRVWDGKSEATKVASLPGGADDCRAIVIDRALHHIALIGYRGGVPPYRLRVFDADGKALATRKVPGPFAAALTGDWFSGTDDNAINATSKASRTFVAWKSDEAPTTQPPAGVLFETLGSAKEVLGMGPRGILGLTDPSTGARRELPRSHGIPRTGVFSRDASRLFVFFEADGAKNKNGIATYEMPAASERRFELESWASDYVVSHDGRWVLATDGMSVLFLDAKSGEKRLSAPVNRPTRK